MSAFEVKKPMELLDVEYAPTFDGEWDTKIPEETSFFPKIENIKRSSTSAKTRFGCIDGAKIAIKTRVSRPETGRTLCKSTRPNTAHDSSVIISRPDTAHRVSNSFRNRNSRPHTAFTDTNESDQINGKIQRNLPKIDLSSEKVLERLLVAQKKVEETYTRPGTAKTTFLLDLDEMAEIPLNEYLFPPKVKAISKGFTPKPPNVTQSNSYRSSLAKYKRENLVKSVSTVSPNFLIINGHILQESESYLLFRRTLKDAIPALVMLYFLERLQIFALNYYITWAECSFSKIQSFLSLPDSWTKINSQVLLSFFENKREVYEEVRKIGQRYKGINRAEFAATKIQAIWRRYKARCDYSAYKHKKHCVKILVAYLRMRINRRKRLAAREAGFEESFSKIEKLNEKFVKEWDTKFLNQKRTIVMINSMGFGLLSRDNFNIREAQKDFEGRFHQLLDPLVSIIYIIEEMTIGEMAKLKALLNIHFDYDDLIQKKRLVVVEVPRPSYFTNTVSLSSMLLIDSVSIGKITKLVKDQKAYMQPLVASKEEARLCALLNIPIHGSTNAFKLLAHRRDNQRDLAKVIGCETAPGISIEPNSPLNIYEVLNSLHIEHSHIDSWIFKMNGEEDGRGLAYTIPQKNKTVAYDAIKFVDDKLWTTDIYLEQFLQAGGVIEARAPNTAYLEVVALHLEVTPSSIYLAGSNSMIHDEIPFLHKASISPNQSQNQALLTEQGLKIGGYFFDKGYYGMITCEFIAWDTEPNSIVWITSIKPYITKDKGNALRAKFLGRDTNFLSDDLYFSPAQTEYPKLQNLGRVPDFDLKTIRESMVIVQTEEKLYSMTFSGLKHVGNLHLLSQTLDSICRLNEIFVSSDGTGALASTNNNDDISICVIQKSIVKCVDKLLRSLVLLNRALKSPGLNCDNFLECATLAHLQISSDTKISKIKAKSLEDFVLTNSDCCNDFLKKIVPIEAKLISISKASIQLLNCEIPSQKLIVFDGMYGSHVVAKPRVREFKIAPRTHTPAQYLALIEAHYSANGTGRNKDV